MGATAGVRGCRHQAAVTCLVGMAVLLCCWGSAHGATGECAPGEQWLCGWHEYTVRYCCLDRKKSAPYTVLFC